jgi:hypothetical protein
MIAEACFIGLTGGSNLKTHEVFKPQSAFSDTLFPPELVRNQMVQIYEKIKEYIGLTVNTTYCVSLFNKLQYYVIEPISKVVLAVSILL